MQASAIFQRTESGRHEIKNKMHGLTQSERLALIVTDGITSYGDLRKKLTGLSEERFDRALGKLLKKSLIFEVLLAEEAPVLEEFDAKTIDHFLHQDPLDPVTIISIDPEEEFGLDAAGTLFATPQFQQSSPKPVVVDPVFEMTSAGVAPAQFDAVVAIKKPLKVVSVDFYLPLEKKGAGLVGLKAVAPIKIKPAVVNRKNARRTSGLEGAALFFTPPAQKVRWGQGLIFAGVVLIAVWVILALVH